MPTVTWIEPSGATVAVSEGTGDSLQAVRGDTVIAEACTEIEVRGSGVYLCGGQEGVIGRLLAFSDAARANPHEKTQALLALQALCLAQSVTNNIHKCHLTTAPPPSRHPDPLPSNTGWYWEVVSQSPPKVVMTPHADAPPSPPRLVAASAAAPTPAPAAQQPYLPSVPPTVADEAPPARRPRPLSSHYVKSTAALPAPGSAVPSAALSPTSTPPSVPLTPLPAQAVQAAEARRHSSQQQTHVRHDKRPVGHGSASHSRPRRPPPPPEPAQHNHPPPFFWITPEDGRVGEWSPYAVYETGPHDACDPDGRRPQRLPEMPFGRPQQLYGDYGAVLHSDDVSPFLF